MNIKIVMIIIAVLITYSTYTLIGYTDSIRNSKYFIYLGLFIALTSNLFWLLGIKLLDNSQQIFWLSLAFDFIVTLCSVAVPIYLKKVSLNNYTWAGVSLVLLGLFVIKNLGLNSGRQ